ncbi:MAG: DNA translocase FtsK 4TM domain-containing protein [Bacteroidales bacterium]|nr:DNA translocase FtsK 4TM domain-containing protein [Bacteroidales bacterium]
MAKTPVTKKTNRESQEQSSLIGFFKKKETHIAVGVFLLVFVTYFCIILISFLFTGDSDQSKVNLLAFSDLDSIAGKTKNIGGAFGAWASNVIINKWFGVSSFFMVFFGIMLGLRFLGATKVSMIKYFLLNSFGMVWFSLFFGFFFKSFYEDTFLSLGGAHGYFLGKWLTERIGWPGTLLVIVSTLFIFLIFIKAENMPFLQRIFNRRTIGKDKTDQETEEHTLEGEFPDEFEKSWTGQEDKGQTVPLNRRTPSNADLEEEDYDEEESEEDDDDTDNITTSQPAKDVNFEIKVGQGEDAFEEEIEEPEIARAASQIHGKNEDIYDASYMGEYNPRLDLSSYKYPSINLLTKYENADTIINTDEQNSNKRRIQEVLEQFGIRISSITATVGATVTLYEIIPEPGVRISRIKSLENDIALSLSALGIRIIAPIPGKGTIGIEVPNREPQIVSMYSVINSKKFTETKYELPLALGKTITNEVFMVDLCKMPHVLVAGATGQGKSVGLNAMITSLLYKKHPAELKFVLIDPKMVEFNIYSTIEKHFLAKLPDDSKAIVTDFTKVIQTLNSLTREMDDRYNLLMLANCRNLKEYNAKFIGRHLNPEKGHKFLPYIVVVIDEYGDLIMTAGKEIEMPIARIAQKARAVGIHMIIATQRPTTNIITGTIKANFPARVAFRVISVTDSRTILDASGANQLIGRGDLLFSQGSDLVRVQCAFVDTPEVVNITNFIGNQRGYPTAFYLPEPTTDSSSLSGPGADLSERDPMFEEAARLIVIHQQGSTSLIQRKFSIGYNRAGRIIDQLEVAGIIGPSEGSKARQVLVEDEFQLENILARLK